MSILRTLPSMAAACGLTLFAVAAVAQDAPPPPAAQAGQAQQWAQHRAEMRQHMEKMRAEHLKTLHDALSIRPDQEGAWQAFVASMGPAPGERHERGEWGKGEHQRLTTPERLDRMIARQQERLADLQRHAAAVKTFYAALSPTQQRTFDALAESMHGFGRHHGFGHGGPGMKGGMGGMDHMDHPGAPGE